LLAAPSSDFHVVRPTNPDTCFSNLPLETVRWDIGFGMAFPQAHPERRARRVQLAPLVSASVHRDNGQRTKGKLHTVSTTGGVLQLDSALAQGDFVEIAFQTQAGMVQGLAEMLNPRKQPHDGVLQPFRFVALGDDDNRALRMTVHAASDGTSFKLDSLSPRKHL
jgi:hypothetical protein